MQRQENLILLLIAILTAIVCHLIFSPYGFNPTDEGFVLSSSMRLLHGQVPHVDFSSLRPMGYGYLHIPELLISKDHTFLISRFVFWLEMSLIAYFWILILQTRSVKYDLRSTVFLYLVTFIFNCHYFPMAVLHTIDGLLLALIGFFILFRYEKLSWMGGLFIGYAVLCKQGFVVLIPLIWFIFPNKKVVIITSIIPGIVYAAYVSACGGWNDMLTQLTAHSEILEVGLLNYILNPFLLCGIAACLISRKLMVPKTVILWLVTLSLILLLESGHYHGKGLMLLFGFVLCELFFEKENWQFYILAIVLAWCVSISVGYASIALFSGGLICLLYSFQPSYELFAIYDKGNRKNIANPFLLLIICLAVFFDSRTTHIYREAPRTQLTYNLSEIVPGAAGIYTNSQSNAVLVDIFVLRQEYTRLLLLPDFTAVQLFNYDRNILTEWPNRAEIPNKKILEKVTSRLKTDSTAIIAIPKYQTALLSDALKKTDLNDYEIVQFIKTNFKKFEETRFFDLYRK